MFFFYFRYKLYSNLQPMPCELLVFSLFTRHLFFLSSCYFSFSRISSALIPLASNFLSTASASSFFASSAALASAFVFFASKEASSFSAFFSDTFFAFRAFFCSSIAFWMYAISVVKVVICSCFFRYLGCVVISFGTIFTAFRSGQHDNLFPFIMV